MNNNFIRTPAKKLNKIAFLRNSDAKAINKQEIQNGEYENEEDTITEEEQNQTRLKRLHRLTPKEKRTQAMSRDLVDTEDEHSGNDEREVKKAGRIENGGRKDISKGIDRGKKIEERVRLVSMKGISRKGHEMNRGRNKETRKKERANQIQMKNKNGKNRQGTRP